MKLNFLSAAVPLTKTLDQTGKTIQSYPMVKKFTSHEANVHTIEDLYASIQAFSKMGCCLIKGGLSKPINKEPRAGLTNAMEPTTLFILDYDAAEVVSSVDDLLHEIYPPLTETDHIVQYSASAGLKPGSGLRCHVYFLLDSPATPDLLKLWVLARNYDVPILASQIKLSANCMALVHPLDPTVNQNDKLIFLAPPNIQGGSDPIPERITLFKRTNRTLGLAFPNNPNVIVKAKDELVQCLQKAAGLAVKKPKTKLINGEEILMNPGVITVTGQKSERGFTYLNVSGGDSWAYYFNESSPNIVRNFKGEPFFYVKDALPELHKDVTRRLSGTLDGVPLVFREHTTDRYYAAVISGDDVTRLSVVSNKEKLKDFVAQYGAEAPAFIPDWDLVFDPTTNDKFSKTRRWMNLFTPTKYMLDTAITDSMPRVLGLLIRHVCVDAETYAHFINWLAFIFQRRTLAKTAWLFQGTTGTGKGFLFHKVISALFGPEYSQPIILSELDDRFNAFMENKLFIFVDEVDFDHSANGAKTMEKLKNHITEPTISVRAMRSNTVSVPNHANFIFSSNVFAPIPIASNDRRFNIAPRQETTLLAATGLDRADLELAAELELDQLAAYLRNFPVNLTKAASPLLNAAKSYLIDAAKSSIDVFFDALKSGDIEYFTGSINVSEHACILVPEEESRKLVRSWVRATLLGETVRVTTMEMAKLFSYMQGTPTSLNKFGRMCTKHDLPVKPVRIGHAVLRGFEINFTYMESLKAIQFSYQDDVMDLASTIT